MRRGLLALIALLAHIYLASWKVWNFTTVRLGLMLARVTPTIFSNPAMGRAVWMTSAPSRPRTWVHNRESVQIRTLFGDRL
jgi:hypothetical protein